MVALIAAAPKALETRDGKEHLYPFMLAAVGEDSSIDAVYNLLRETPWLVSRDFGDRGRREGAAAQGTMPSSKGHLHYSSMILLPVAFLLYWLSPTTCCFRYSCILAMHLYGNNPIFR